MTWKGWIGSRIFAASVIAGAFCLCLAGAQVVAAQWREELWAARRIADKDRPAAIRALEALTKKAQEEHEPAAEYEALVELAAYLRLEGRIGEAIGAYKRLDAFPAFEPMPGLLKGGRETFKGWIADLSCREAPYDEGIAMYRQMIAASGGRNTHPQFPLSSLYKNLARCLIATNRVDEALGVLRENVARVTRDEWAGQFEDFEAHATLARALADVSRLPDARAAFLALLPIFEARNRIDAHDPAEVDALRRIGRAKTREEKDQLRAAREKERARQQQQMEKELILLIDGLTRRGTFNETATP